MGFVRLYKAMIRKKPLMDSSDDSKLAKVLSTFDLTALGVGSTLGVGVYVLAGEVAKTTAGPAVVISFLIAAIASVFAGLCYAEFGARVPRAGSAYIYSYVSIGEFIGFLIGWNLILEYAIGSASVVKGMSTYLDSLLNYTMKNTLTELMPINVSGLGEYPDFFAFFVTIAFSLALAFGAKESSALNNVLTLTNVAVILYVVVTGSFKANIANWQIPSENVPSPEYGNGGFMPYGISGVIKGAAICFYGFIGFDCIATASEEAKNPKRSIPISIILSLLIIFVAYFSISTVLTMMLPYYAQDENAPLPFVFKYYGWQVAEYIVSIGAMFGLGASLMGAMFPLPRVIYAMAIDGLVFEFMGRIHERFRTPIIGTLLAGFLTGTLAMLFNLTQLISMMSIGTLLAYSMVAACVLLLRYETDESTANGGRGDGEGNDKDLSMGQIKSLTLSKLMRQITVSIKQNEPTQFSSSLVTWLILIYCAMCAIVCVILTQWEDAIVHSEWYAILVLAIAVIVLVGNLFLISLQPKSRKELSFSVPLTPWLPAVSIFINIYLMLKLDVMTWIRFAVWIAIGLTIYFGYGITHSKERVPLTKKSSIDK